MTAVCGDDDRAVARHLHDGPLEAHGGHDLAAGLGRTGEADAVDPFSQKPSLMSRSTQTLVLEPKPARMGRMDVAVNLVESYLRLNGYLTLSELEIQGKTEDGSFETLTDVDIVALRFPGAMYAADAHDQDEAALLLIDDDELRLEEDVVDLIIGEVKQGEAVFNAGLRRHQVLHAVLRRVEWLLDGTSDLLVHPYANSSKPATIS